MFLLFFLLWLLLSGGISVHTCLWGVAVSALISWFCKRVLGYQWRVFCGSPSRIWARRGILLTCWRDAEGRTD